jgi:hypothetical protein
MKQQIISEGKEALERALLIMKYDMKKTLTENVKVISEQSQSCSPLINDAELNTIVETVWDMLDKMTTVFSQGFYVTERAKKIYDNVNKLVGKKYNDSITQECKSSMDEFLERFAVRSEKGGGFISTEPDIKALIDEALNETGVKENIVAQKYLKLTKKIIETGVGVVKAPEQTKDDVKKDGGSSDDVKKDGGSSAANIMSYKLCTGKYVKGCKSPRIKELQNCLGTLYTGRNDIYFGDLTQAALKAKGYENGVTDADIDKICNKEIDTPVVDSDSLNAQ